MDRKQELESDAKQLNKFYEILSRFFEITDKTTEVKNEISHMGWLFPLITQGAYLQYALGGKEKEKEGELLIERARERLGLAKEEPNLLDHSVEGLRRVFRIVAFMTMGADCTDEQLRMAEMGIVGSVISAISGISSLAPEALAVVREEIEEL